MLTFNQLEDGAGLRVVDPVERRQYDFRTPTPVVPDPAETDPFRFPVDDAVTISTASITLPTVVATFVRDTEGRMLAEAEHGTSRELPVGSYSVEINAPVKCYLRVESALTIEADNSEMELRFGDETEVSIGARSSHENPAGTITVPDDPEAAMTAISALSSALKTTSPERSFPTLRGHPPTIERGERLDVPEALDPPETGIRIEIPPNYEYIYPAAPLSYYLGAELVPASTPRLVTDSGFERPLPTAPGFEDEIERLLKGTFLLDCVVRTEGLYEIELHERAAVEETLPFDPAAAYDQPIAERVETYLSVPYHEIEAHVPEWKLTTHIGPTADRIETLPFVIDDLAVVRTATETETAPAEQVAAVNEFMRDDETFTRSTTESTNAELSLVEPEETGSIEQAWVGEDAPLGATKTTTTAFENRLDRTISEGDISIAVVCNDERMLDEYDAVAGTYGSRESLPFDVELHERLTSDELADVLRTDREFVHYIGHIDDAGFRCSDGYLDVSEIDEVGVDAFLLNACRSYTQGMALIEGGAIGGVVTLEEVVDREALEVGKTIAGLLNHGFPIRAAMDVVEEYEAPTGAYVVVGDGNADITQVDNLTPLLWIIDSVESGYQVRPRSYPTGKSGMGTMFTTYTAKDGRYYVGPKSPTTRVLSAQELMEIFDTESEPMIFDNKFIWSSEIDLSSL